MSVFKVDKNTKDKAFLYPITLKLIYECFTKEYKYRYLGISWNMFSANNAKSLECHNYLQEFIEFVDSQAKPKWCPRWFLNLLHLIGNDNSICRCRSQKISSLHHKLCKGIMITDIKEKWGTLRIYGNFTDAIYKKIEETCEKINPFLEAY